MSHLTHVDEIYPGVYLGCRRVFDKKHLSFLQSLTHVITVCNTSPFDEKCNNLERGDIENLLSKDKKQLQFLHIKDKKDIDETDLFEDFEKICRFMGEAYKRVNEECKSSSKSKGPELLESDDLDSDGTNIQSVNSERSISLSSTRDTITPSGSLSELSRSYSRSRSSRSYNRSSRSKSNSKREDTPIGLRFNNSSKSKSESLSQSDSDSESNPNTKIYNDVKILFHCEEGCSRSPTVLIAFLMSLTNSSFRACYHAVQMRRFLIDPNPGFVRQLETWEVVGMKDSNTVNNINSDTGVTDLNGNSDSMNFNFPASLRLSVSKYFKERFENYESEVDDEIQRFHQSLPEGKRVDVGEMKREWEKIYRKAEKNLNQSMYSTVPSGNSGNYGVRFRDEPSIYSIPNCLSNSNISDANCDSSESFNVKQDLGVLFICFMVGAVSVSYRIFYSGEDWMDY